MTNVISLNRVGKRCEVTHYCIVTPPQKCKRTNYITSRMGCNIVMVNAVKQEVMTFESISLF